MEVEDMGLDPMKRTMLELIYVVFVAKSSKKEEENNN